MLIAVLLTVLAAMTFYSNPLLVVQLQILWCEIQLWAHHYAGMVRRRARIGRLRCKLCWYRVLVLAWIAYETLCGWFGKD